MHCGTVAEDRGVDIPTLLRFSRVGHHEGFMDRIFGEEYGVRHCLLLSLGCTSRLLVELLLPRVPAAFFV